MSCIRPRDHVWVELHGGNRERCERCKTVFPCRHTCEHLDCRTERGEPLPKWASPSSPLDRLAALLEPKS